jgi:hypothetical protein
MSVLAMDSIRLLARDSQARGFCVATQMNLVKRLLLKLYHYYFSSTAMTQAGLATWPQSHRKILNHGQAGI